MCLTRLMKRPLAAFKPRVLSVARDCGSAAHHRTLNKQTADAGVAYGRVC